MLRFDGALPAVVALGGGHGLYATLQALRRIATDITAVVTVADDGGSSGRLRQDFPILPPGDLRMALAALCGDDEEGRAWADVLQSRFGGEGPLAGHAIGNLLLAGVWQRLDDPVAGLDMVAKLLKLQGRVLPASSIPLDIEADVIGLRPEQPDAATLVRGQACVAASPGRVRSVRLTPDAPPACPQALSAIDAADWVILGPGSWFTSVLPHLLVPDLAAAIVGARAQRVVVMNVEAGQETAGFTPVELLDVLADHAPGLRLDAVLVDPSFVDAADAFDRRASLFGARLVVDRVRASDGSPRHDVNRLAGALADLMGLVR